MPSRSVARVPAGVPGLDALIGGGFPLHRTVLVCGDRGSGKTTFALRFLMEGAARGDAGVLVGLDQPPLDVLESARRLGWDVDAAIDQRLMTLLDASASFTELRRHGGWDARQVASDLARQIRSVRARRLVIDGLGSLIPGGRAAGGVEDFMRSLIASLDDNLECTTLLTIRTVAGAHASAAGPAAEQYTSGVIELREDRMGRALRIRKMRGAPMALGDRRLDAHGTRGLMLHPARPSRDSVDDVHAAQIV